MLEILHIAEFGPVVEEFDRIEFETEDGGIFVTIEARTDEFGPYFKTAVDYYVGPGDMWHPAYLGCTGTLLEAWQRVFAAL